MSKRMQILMDEGEFRAIRMLARRKRMTVAEWVRQTLRSAFRAVPSSEPERKIARIRAAARLSFPTADIERMLTEIESGYLQERGG
ncbi:MAG: antitoxin [Planctomycetes bacterium]|nr:antitoxin [Planctomycetota bacterium]